MKTDLRVIKTEEALYNALFELIEEKGFVNVTVSDITERAKINRNTFYLHYSSKEDFVEKIVENSFSEQVGSFDMDKIIKARTNRKNIHQLYERVFSVIEEKIDLYRIILTDPNLSGYITRLMKKIKNEIKRTLKKSKKIDIGVEFLVYGIYGILVNWIVYAIGTREENVDVITDFSLQTYKKLFLMR